MVRLPFDHSFTYYHQYSPREPLSQLRCSLNLSAVCGPESRITIANPMLPPFLTDRWQGLDFQLSCRSNRARINAFVPRIQIQGTFFGSLPVQEAILLVLAKRPQVDCSGIVLGAA